MSHEIELISDGEGLLVVGAPDDVEMFLSSEGLAADTATRGGLGSALRSVAAAVDTVANIAENSGRWVKLTKESSAAIKKYGLMESGTSGVQHAMIGSPGEIKQWIQIVTNPGALASNPAMLSGAAGMMAQLAMQQLVDEITAYLEVIDRKLDAVLRAQTNQVLARMDGVEFMLREASTIKETVGRVSDVTWSKMQHSSSVILETQAFALRQLADLAVQLERSAKIDDLAAAAAEAHTETQKWLNVLARCVQLHDSIAVIELDRVMDSSPDELEQHLIGLRAARANRLELFAKATNALLERMSAAVEKANSKVLLNPMKSPAVVRANNDVAASIHDFHEVLSIESARQSAEARKWIDAAAETWDDVRDKGADSVEAVKTLTAGTRKQAMNVKEKIANKVAERSNKHPNP